VTTTNTTTEATLTRQDAIKRAAADVASAADYSLVGTEGFFGVVTAENITDSISARIASLQRVLAMTDAEWDKMWADSAAEERRIEDDVLMFAAGKA
jgi:hypothetical protein